MVMRSTLRRCVQEVARPWQELQPSLMTDAAARAARGVTSRTAVPADTAVAAPYYSMTQNCLIYA
jgi:hypothetical protein